MSSTLGTSILNLKLEFNVNTRTRFLPRRFPVSEGERLRLSRDCRTESQSNRAHSTATCFDTMVAGPMFTQTVSRALCHLGLDQRGTNPHPRQPTPMLLQKADAMFSPQSGPASPSGTASGSWRPSGIGPCDSCHATVIPSRTSMGRSLVRSEASQSRSSMMVRSSSSTTRATRLRGVAGPTKTPERETSRSSVLYGPRLPARQRAFVA
jgi:hypothetical protein